LDNCFSLTTTCTEPHWHFPARPGPLLIDMLSRTVQTNMEREMREPGTVRRRRLLAVVEARGQARVAELAAELEVSVITVRRDVEELARAGKLRRGHGVARSLVPRRDPAPEPRASDGPVALVIPERH